MGGNFQLSHTISAECNPYTYSTTGDVVIMIVVPRSNSLFAFRPRRDVQPTSVSQAVQTAQQDPTYNVLRTSPNEERTEEVNY